MMGTTPNDFVRVKLTDAGRDLLRKQRQELAKSLRDPTVLKGDGVPKEDEEGWSRWQLWHLMQTFGGCGLGSPIPFDDFDVGPAKEREGS